MERLMICVTVGYVLKILKNGKDLNQFKNEFDSIRHGDYLKFIELVGGPMPYIVRYDNGEIISGFLSPLIDDIDFELLLKAGPSLKIFLEKSFSTYGLIKDNDISDDIFEQLALFEISLRIHAKNANLIKSEDKLNYVINVLSKFKQLESEDIFKIHEGRRFLNMVKHDNKQFLTWSDGLIAFEESLRTIAKYNLGW